MTRKQSRRQALRWLVFSLLPRDVRASEAAVAWLEKDEVFAKRRTPGVLRPRHV